MVLVPVNEPTTIGLVVTIAEPEIDDEDVVHPLPSVKADIEYVVGELTGVTEITCGELVTPVYIIGVTPLV